jgi:Chloramphenicol phosphotransferase-like protein
VFVIGVHCELPILKEREPPRGNRSPGLARKQFDRVHAEALYDMEIDTSSMAMVACVRTVLETNAFARLRLWQQEPSILARGITPDFRCDTLMQLPKEAVFFLTLFAFSNHLNSDHPVAAFLERACTPFGLTWPARGSLFSGSLGAFGMQPRTIRISACQPLLRS